MYQVVEGGTGNAQDINQIIQAISGLSFADPGPLVQIATKQLTANTAALTFNNIPQVRNLFIAWSNTGSSNASLTADLTMRINADSTANYFNQSADSNGSSIFNSSAQNQTAMKLGAITGSTSVAPQSSCGFAYIGNWPSPANNLLSIGMGVSFSGTGGSGMDVELSGGEYDVNGTARTSLTLQTTGNLVGTSTMPATFSLFGSM